MTILDRSDAKRIRIDANQFADELSRRLPGELSKHLPDDVDPVAWAQSTAADLRKELAKAGADLRLDGRLEEAGTKLRSLVTAPAIRSLVTRLERELPDTDRDRYDRAYTRGRVQARSIWIVVGLAAGVTAGVAGALLLDPKRGAERRAALKARARTLGDQLGTRAKEAADRAREVAAERGIGGPSTETGLDALPAEAAEAVGEVATATASIAAEAPTTGTAPAGVPVMDPAAAEGQATAREVPAVAPATGA